MRSAALELAAAFVLAPIALLFLTACGEDTPAAAPTPPGVTVDATTTAEIADPAIASIQRAVRRLREKGELDTTSDDWRSHLPLRPRATFEPGRTYLWNLETSEGTVRMRLRPDLSPDHVASAIYLTLLGFHDGLPFYSVFPGKSAAGGCPLGTGRGSPGFAFSGPPGERRPHDVAGLLSAVSLGQGTDDSKFRITFAPAPALDEHETVYGELLGGAEGAEGKAALARIEALGTPSGTPTKVVRVVRASVTVR